MFRKAVAAATFAAALTFVCAVGAESPAVTLAEVSTTVGHEEIVPMMKEALVTDLASVKIPSGKKFVVSASLTKFETSTSGSNATTSCVVSLAIRDASGSLKAVLSGSGSTVAKRTDAAAQREVVNAAVHGATKGFPAIAQ